MQFATVSKGNLFEEFSDFVTTKEDLFEGYVLRRMYEEGRMA